ncbi:outer membrane beta-barrel protein [Fulvivirga sedimenti]|uniref:Porin family protein n=1 Tax=Fulvivirga sedimenti TaxID=2879465 RepID=A0A9X1KWZ8_9BACT|nr:outer membrane beta-barrel protein [Fulvivirga sedimenti]MCA6074464.1 porin family protein [Fulvivirga sedimenti]
MKKIIIAAILFLGINFSGLAQEVRLNTYAGYVFKDRVDSYYSSSSYFDGTIQDGFRWGAGIEFHIPGRGAVEIQYLRQDTNAPTTYRDSGFLGGDIQFTNFDLAINYILINGTRYFPTGGPVEPFVGMGAGLGIFNTTNPDNGNNRNATKFSWQLRGGTNIWLADRVAIRIEASLLSAVQAVGGGLYFGTGGVGAGLSTYSSMYQFGFDGGLVFRLRE